MNNTERRRFLKVVSAAGLTAATMPFARMAMAQSSSPRRALFVYTPDGCDYDSWHPTGQWIELYAAADDGSLGAGTPAHHIPEGGQDVRTRRQSRWCGQVVHR